MKHLKKSFLLLMLLTAIPGSVILAQDSIFLEAALMSALAKDRADRANDVLLDNEYVYTGLEKGFFYPNPLRLDGKPLDYAIFNRKAKGELTVTKGAAITNRLVVIPFYVYLRRDGKKVTITGKESCDPGQMDIEISEILKHAEPGDELVIEPVRKEDGPAKRILKLVDGC